MALDPSTMLTLTIALAAAAALYLAIEWRTFREHSLLLWSAGFATISVGCTLALQRNSGHMLLGIWFANGLLVTAHWLFLLGVARFTETRISRAWHLVFVVWTALLLLPAGPLWSKLMFLANSLLVAVLAIRASLLLRPLDKSMGAGAVQLHYILLGHGLFYLAKTIPVWVPGSLLDLTDFRGEIIQISLVEGVMAIMLIALSMTGSVRYRRERRIERLASRDPLTGMYNRRALEARAPRLLQGISPASPGALLLIDIDNFKQVNDLHGHSAGDRLLVALSRMILELRPDTALTARLGGDEFVMLLGDTSSEQVDALGASLGERFKAEAASHFSTPEPVTLSIGANLFNQPPNSLMALMEQGDIALYASKRGGRNSMRTVDSTRLAS